MSKLLKYVILILGVILLSTCTHEKDIPVDCGDAQTIVEMKEWVFFKTGTYWIYEEQNTGALDTVTVIAHSEGTSAGGFETFGTLMHSSFDDYNYDYWFNDSYSGKCPDNTCICRRVFCSKYKTGNYFGEGGTFFFPIIVGNYIGVGFGGGEGGISEIDAHIFDYMLNNELYLEVLRFYIENCVMENWNDAQYVLARDVGIVEKKSLESNTHWVLIENFQPN